MIHKPVGFGLKFFCIVNNKMEVYEEHISSEILSSI